MTILKKLKNASELALCANVINKIRTNEDLTTYQCDWLFNLLNTSKWDNPKEDQGRISLILIDKNDSLSEILLLLNDKINKKQQLDCDDWTFILYAVKVYRSFLLEESSWIKYYSQDFT